MIAAGGTAGHVVPALAVADALRADGAEVVFIGGERAEAQLVPGGGLSAAPHRGRGAEPHATRCAPRARSCARLARCPARARCCARWQPTRCSAAGATCPAPVGLAALTLRLPLVLTEADSHLGLSNRMLAPVRAAGLPGVPDRRSRRAALPRHRPARPAACGRPRRRRASAFGIAAGGAVRARVRRLARLALDQRCGALEAFAARRSASCTCAGAATTASWPRASCPARYDLREYLDSEAFAEALEAADLVGGPRRRVGVRAGRLRPAGDPRALSARRRRPPERQRPLDGRRGRGARARRRGAERPRASRARWRAAGRPRARWRRWRAPRAALARPDAAQEVAGELLAAAARRPMGAGARPWSGRRIHFVGVGGAGMSAYARAARALGPSVSGSDASESPYLLGLRADGVARGAVVGHAAANVPSGRTSSCSTPARSRRRTPSAWRRASGAWPSTRARSCSPS